MNHYKTPCNPYDCERYTLDGCKVKCNKAVEYLAIKAAMRHEKELQAQSYDQRSKGVDKIYKSLRGNKHRVGANIKRRIL